MPYCTVVQLYRAAFILKLLKIPGLRLVIIAISAEIMMTVHQPCRETSQCPAVPKGTPFRNPHSPSPIKAHACIKRGTFIPVLVPQAGYQFCINQHKTALEEIKPVFFPSG